MSWINERSFVRQVNLYALKNRVAEGKRHGNMRKWPKWVLGKNVERPTKRPHDCPFQIPLFVEEASLNLHFVQKERGGNQKEVYILIYEKC
jgi:hypothetical protein